MSYPWFEILNDGVNSLEQGDFIPNCPILIPPNNIQDNQEVEIEVKQIDSIILSNENKSDLLMRIIIHFG